MFSLDDPVFFGGYRFLTVIECSEKMSVKNTDKAVNMSLGHVWETPLLRIPLLPPIDLHRQQGSGRLDRQESAFRFTFHLLSRIRKREK